MACYEGRLIIPTILRKEILEAIHAAHQGVSSMNRRVDQSVYWPDISTDLHNQYQSKYTIYKKPDLLMLLLHVMMD